ncbi:M28 family peptidase [Mycolicibacterium palauense]|uniref:M28 family peptidase n=1 Tax=Mycolicibacterium palauense TaxID=2034511 RepID=UPI003898FB2B
MTLRPRAAGSLAAALSALLLLTSCAAGNHGAEPPEPAMSFARQLAAAVKVDALVEHLQRLQAIADEHRGTRADGTAGFDASVDYVVTALRNRGFDVQTPQFQRLETLQPGHPRLTVGGRTYEVDQASLLLRTPADGVRGRVLVPRNSAGCSPADYPGTPGSVAPGGIAVVDDTGCSVVAKHDAAVARGAAALVVISEGGRNGSPPGLFGHGYYEGMTIPVAVAGPEAGSAMRRTSAPVRLLLDTEVVKVVSHNVLAQTRTGSQHDVVVVGAHLDSVAEGPGINDDGSGVAAVLETALQLGPAPETANAVRFAFWGAEERRLAGSVDYVFGLSRTDLNDIALYLNFDMLASPNAGYFTYDGDQSGPVSPQVDPDDVPAGSAGIERTLAGYLNLAGRRPADMPLAADTDYSPFLTAGVPIGGVTTGADQTMTNTQARLWDGTAGRPFDPNYHTAGDDVAAVNREALAVTAPAAAFAVATYAQSIDGVNGVPARDRRHRAALAP